MGTMMVGEEPLGAIALDVLDSLLEGCQVIDFDYRYRFVNEAALRQKGATLDELLGKRVSDCHPGVDETPMFKKLRTCMLERTYQRMESDFQFPDGSHGCFALRFLPVPEGVCVLSLDVTDTKQRTAELAHMQDQLRHSQKMEAIGRLAGGVAHDFNNILSVILTYAMILQTTLPEGSPSIGDAREIAKAAERAARLTAQLLAFSRRQVTQPRVVDLTEIVMGMNQMTERLLGDDVQVRAVYDPEPAHIKADPSQLEQVMINLIVNARDAMPGGGKVTIETRRVLLDARYAEGHLGIAPGPYVMLVVSDTGMGMDAATQERVFEPFFSTKGPHRAAGLGLSTVYGIVQQNGGAVWVQSELGQGTTFRVYWPETSEPKVTLPPPPSSGRLGGAETILLAEDDEQLRRVAQAVLEAHGYHVLPAKSGRAAVDACARHSGNIDLLLTDVVMPGLNGRELAAELVKVRPGLRVLYMTGYTEDAVLHRGVLTAGVVLLQKPITPDRLLTGVRQVLDTPR